MSFLTYVYLSAVLLAFVSSLICFRLDLPRHLKIFSLLLGLTLVVEIWAFYSSHNYRIYSIFAPIEFWVYGYFYYQVIHRRIARKVIFFFLLIFPIFSIINLLSVFSSGGWMTYIIIAGSFFSVVFALMYYYQLVTGHDIPSLRNVPEFWIATGMLIFYLGSLPFLGPLEFIMNLYMTVAETLEEVLKVLDTIMYTLFTVGFLCQIPNPKKSSSSL